MTLKLEEKLKRQFSYSLYTLSLPFIGNETSALYHRLYF